MTDRTSVTAVVDRLVDGGVVIKRTSPEDRRRAAVRITPKGRTVLRGAPRPPGVHVREREIRIDGRVILRRTAASCVLAFSRSIPANLIGTLCERPLTATTLRMTVLCLEERIDALGECRDLGAE